MQQKNTHHLMCLKCGKYFDYSTPMKKTCPACDEKRRKAKPKKKNTVKFKTLTEVMQELKAYNEKHGTCLTYGQYVAMCEGR